MSEPKNNLGPKVHNTLNLGLRRSDKSVGILTVDDHPLYHEIFVVVRGHDAPVIAGQLDGGVDDVQGAVHGLVVVRGPMIEVDAMSEHAYAERFLALDPLVHGPCAVVEVPRDHQSDGVRTQRIQTVEHNARLSAGHDGGGHAEFGERHVTCKQKPTIMVQCYAKITNKLSR